jgi:hypothetical protein
MTSIHNTSADKAHEADPRPHNVVRSGSTVAQELRYLLGDRQHIAALAKLAELVTLAKWVEEKRDTAHYGPQHVLELRTSLFRAQVASAEGDLESLRLCVSTDIWDFSHEPITALAKAIADYLNLPLSKSWTVDGLIDDIGRLP